MPDKQFYARFWGVRGSVPVSGPATTIFGGNTPCVEMRCGDRVLMFDSGSGAFAFGQYLLQTRIRQIDVLFTHCHYDHIEGAPFFAPVHEKDWQVRYWSGHLYGKMTTREMMEKYMASPFFPVGPEVFNATTEFNDFKPETRIDFDDGIIIKTAPLNHPDGAVGYRVDFDGYSICYITDIEHTDGPPPQNLCKLVQGADIMIYDASFCDSEFRKYKGWGHSTWQKGMELAEMCNVTQFVAFHHQPGHDDNTLMELEKTIKARNPLAVVAREGMILEPRQLNS